MSDIVIIKKYNSAPAAYIDAGLLEDNGVGCAVNGADLINAMPLTGDQITLSVAASDEVKARELLSNS